MYMDIGLTWVTDDSIVISWHVHDYIVLRLWDYVFVETTSFLFSWLRFETTCVETLSYDNHPIIRDYMQFLHLWKLKNCYLSFVLAMFKLTLDGSTSVFSRTTQTLKVHRLRKRFFLQTQLTILWETPTNKKTHRWIPFVNAWFHDGFMMFPAPLRLRLSKDPTAQ